MVVDVLAVHAVAVTAGARVDADVGALLGGEAVEDLVVQVNEGLEEVGASPRVARVLLGGQTALSEVDADALGAGLEAQADVLLALVDQVLDELVLRVALDLAWKRVSECESFQFTGSLLTLQRVQQVQHAGRNDGLLQAGLLGERLALLKVVGGIGVVLQRALDEARKLPVVSIVEDGEELAVGREILGQALAAKRVNDGVGRERGSLAQSRSAFDTAFKKCRFPYPLLAVSHELGASLLEALDRVGCSLVLRRKQLLPRGRARVIGGIHVLQVLGPRQGSNGLGGNGHCVSVFQMLYAYRGTGRGRSLI